MFPNFYFPGSDVLLATFDYDINAISDAGTSAAAIKTAGYQLTDSFPGLRAADRIVINLNLDGAFVAWSPWGIPADVGGNSGSTAGFAVVFPDNTISNNSASGAPHDGYAAARAQWLLDYPDGVEYTGKTDYWFGISDNPIGDNSGGQSITVQIFGRSR